jgi:hypothetical protein
VKGESDMEDVGKAFSSFHMTSTGHLVAASLGYGSTRNICLLIALDEMAMEDRPSIMAQLDAHNIPSSLRHPGQDFR